MMKYGITNYSNFALYFVLPLIILIGASKDYEWESLNYYEILGLNGGEDDTTVSDYKAYNQTEIKRAYRRQAQLHHPDKQKNKESEHMDEVNARFAKIAEAYEILSDEEKKLEYDSLLEHDTFANSGQFDGEAWQRGQSAYGYYDDNIRRRRHNFASEFRFSDPNELFQNLFSSFSGYQGKGQYFDPYFNKYERTGRNRSRPTHVSETQEILYDPQTDTEILRVIRREEFRDSNYFRLIAQEFVQDLRYGNITPISEPYIAEEGHLSYRKENIRNRDRKASGNRPNFLNEGSVLRPGNSLWSRNGKYHASLTSTCEFYVMRNSGTDEDFDDFDDGVVWSSENFTSRGSQCFVTVFQGDVMVVAGYDLRNVKGVIWSSESMSSHKQEEIPIDSKYYLVLDDDGSLVVYLHSSESSEERDGREKNYFSEFKDKFRHPSTTKAAMAWKFARRWVEEKIRISNSNSLGDTCIWTSSIAGCNSSVRKLLSAGRNMKRIAEIALHNFVRQLEEGSENDIDFIDTAFRVIGKASSSVGKVGASLAKKGLFEGKVASKVFRDVVHDKIRRWSKSSSSGESTKHSSKERRRYRADA
mmetsp:Transcript_12849/g.19500  ORF Transcript_12849/g.19500 Transcript_12849/m.19500 type:complete len:587 (+) Transcript_12849:73-1833(+)